jgi:hypothetical protein
MADPSKREAREERKCSLAQLDGAHEATARESVLSIHACEVCCSLAPNFGGVNILVTVHVHEVIG